MTHAPTSDHSPAPSFHAVKRDRTSRQIVAQLENAILGSQFRSGERLPTERELADQFGTSRSSVREALRTLEQTGLVVVRQGAGGGAFVSMPGALQVGQTLHRLAQLGEFDEIELYAARRAIEPGIAAEAAARATPAALADLERALDGLRARAGAGADTADVSRRFHLLIAEATGNALLVLLATVLLDLAHRLDTTIPHAPRPKHLVVDEHEALFEAIRQGDGEQARALTFVHLSELGQQTAAERRGA